MAGGKTFKRDQKRRKEMARKLKQEEKMRKRLARKEEKKSGDDLPTDEFDDTEISPGLLDGRFLKLAELRRFQTCIFEEQFFHAHRAKVDRHLAPLAGAFEVLDRTDTERVVSDASADPQAVLALIHHPNRLGRHRSRARGVVGTDAVHRGVEPAHPPDRVESPGSRR